MEEVPSPATIEESEPTAAAASPTVEPVDTSPPKLSRGDSDDSPAAQPESIELKETTPSDQDTTAAPSQSASPSSPTSPDRV